MRRSAVLPLLAALLVACAPTTDLTARGQLPAPAVSADDVLARAAVVRFLEAYERVPIDGGTALFSLAGSPAVEHWVAWLAVQYRQAGGTVEAQHDLGGIGPMLPVEMTDGSEGRLVDIAAEVVFRIAPDEGEPRVQVRSLDGPMVLAQDSAEGWKVADFTRDGVLLTNSVYVFPPGQGVEQRGVTISLDSFIADADQWAIGIVVRNDTERTIGVDPEFVGVFDVIGSRVDTGIVPEVLNEIAPGEQVGALVAYQIPQGEEVSGLRLYVGTRIPGDDRLVFLGVPVRPVLRTLERAGLATPSPSPAGTA
jgi:hypothetical protein